MKHLLIIIFNLLTLLAIAQNEFKNLSNIEKIDLASVWTTDSLLVAVDAEKINNEIVPIYDTYKKPQSKGFIGKNYQRFSIHFDTVYKSKKNNLEYKVFGKTKVKSNICIFFGKMVITNVKPNRKSFKNKFDSYKITGKYYFYEDMTQFGSGKLEGNFTINVIIDNENNLKYDAINLVSDGFINNTFVGTWVSHKTKISKKCNWGDFRIPECGDLDIGVGEFSVNKKYIKFGWKNYVKAFVGNYDSPETKQARLIENKQWWK